MGWERCFWQCRKIFKLLLSLEKLSYGTIGVKEFETGMPESAAAEDHPPSGISDPVVDRRSDILYSVYLKDC